MDHGGTRAIDVNSSDIDDLIRAYAQVLPGVREAFDNLHRAFHGTHRALIDAGVLEDPGPTDPMARALWLKQNRNTGPARPSGPTAHRPRSHR